MNRYFCVVKPISFSSTKRKLLYSSPSSLFSQWPPASSRHLLSLLSTFRTQTIYIARSNSTTNRNETILCFSFLSFYMTLPMGFISYCYHNVFVAVRRHNNAVTVVPSLQSSPSNALNRAVFFSQHSSGFLFAGFPNEYHWVFG